MNAAEINWDLVRERLTKAKLAPNVLQGGAEDLAKTLLPATQQLNPDGTVGPRLNKYIPITPTPKQREFLMLDRRDAFYGGAGGGGKSFSLLAAALQFVEEPDYKALLIRRTFKELDQPDALMSLAHQWLGGTDAYWRAKSNRWEFPKGATLTFGYMEHEDDKYQYTGPSWTFIGIDEITQMSESQVEFLFGWLRKAEGNPLPLRFRGASNPIGPGRLWVKQRYVDPKTRGDRVFIPARIEDNPFIDERSYLQSLQSLDPIMRAQIRAGDWEAQAAGKFRRHWFKIISAMPLGSTRYVRYWDLASTEKKESNDPSYTAGVLVGELSGQYFIADIRRDRLTPRGVEELIVQTAQLDGPGVSIRMEQEPGSPIWVEEEVLMGNGEIKALKHIRVGDVVIDGYGIPRRVSHCHEQGLLEAVRITTESGRTVIAALTHPFLTPNGYVEAGKLKVEQSLGLVCRPSIEAQPSPRIAEEFRLAGYFIGDGCCTNVVLPNGASSINAMITCSDSIMAEDIEHCARVLKFEVRARGPQGWHYRLSGGVRDWLRDTGLAGKTTSTKTVPHWVFTAPRELVAHFLGAYFAADGSIYMGSHGLSLEFYSTNYELLHGARHLLMRFGIPSVIRTRMYKNKSFAERRMTMYRMEIRKSSDGQARFCEEIPVFGKKGGLLCQHQQVRERFYESHIADSIVSIDPAGAVECRCLTIEGGHSFTVKDFAVHNSGVRVIDDYTHILAGFDFRGDKVTGPREIRANGLASQAEAGNVFLVQAEWNRSFLDELEVFPGGGHDDMVVAASGAFNEITGVRPVEMNQIILIGNERLSPDW